MTSTNASTVTDAVAAEAASRIGLGDAGWDEFLAGYGSSVLSPTFEDLVLARALVMTTWLLSLPP